MTSNTPTRLLAVEGAYNIRDLGGYPLADGRTTRWRRVLRGDGLHRLSDASVDVLVADGVRLVIDLRGDQELRTSRNPFANRPDVRYENVALFDRLSPLAAHDTGNASFDLAERYRDAVDTCGASIARVLRLIAEQDEGMILFHCTAGKDRTGVIAALLLLTAGVDRATIIRDYAQTANVATILIAELRAHAISRGHPETFIDLLLASYPETMNALLDHIEEHRGGIEAYLASIGLERQIRVRLESVL